MLRVTVELVPFSGGPKKTLAVAEIANVGGTAELGDYDARFYGGEPFADIERLGPEHLTATSKVTRYERTTRNVWDLVAKALANALTEGARSYQLARTGRTCGREPNPHTKCCAECPNGD